MREEPRVIYQVTDFDRARDFFKRLLGFDETFVDFDEGWSALSRGGVARDDLFGDTPLARRLREGLVAVRRPEHRG